MAATSSRRRSSTPPRIRLKTGEHTSLVAPRLGLYRQYWIVPQHVARQVESLGLTGPEEFAYLSTRGCELRRDEVIGVGTLDPDGPPVACCCLGCDGRGEVVIETEGGKKVRRPEPFCPFCLDRRLEFEVRFDPDVPRVALRDMMKHLGADQNERAVDRRCQCFWLSGRGRPSKRSGR